MEIGGWLVLQITQEESQVKLTFLHLHWPSSSFKYPETQDILIVPIDDILTLVDPRGRTYTAFTLHMKSFIVSVEYLVLYVMSKLINLTHFHFKIDCMVQTLHKMV